MPDPGTDRSIRSPTRSLLFLCDGSRVLLARKKTGFGAGKIVGVGGTAEPGETIEQTALRELQEETGVRAADPLPVAWLEFYFPSKPAHWDMRVVAFIAHDWQGEPHETEEVAPRWFPLDGIPYREMWDDDRFWLPKVLSGERLSGWFVFGEDQRVVRHHLQPFGS